MEHYNNNPEIVAAAKHLAPNLVIVSLGTNESFGKNFGAEYFYGQISRMVAAIRSAMPDAAIMFTTPMENCRRSRGRYTVNKNVRLASEVLMAHAKEFGYAVWNWYDICGGAGAAKAWSARGLMQKDRIHLTAEGYRLQSELLFAALTRDME
jgi:lysophospholipase L1-like esterase